MKNVKKSPKTEKERKNIDALLMKHRKCEKNVCGEGSGFGRMHVRSFVGDLMRSFQKGASLLSQRMIQNNLNQLFYFIMQI